MRPGARLSASNKANGDRTPLLCAAGDSDTRRDCNATTTIVRMLKNNPGATNHPGSA